MHWCSDPLRARPPEQPIRLRAIVIDVCDRAIITWSATTAGVFGAMVRDLMIACVERRVGTSKAPIEWLSNNAAYIAKDTLDAATALRLRPCFTPVGSQEVKRHLRGFVETFKRDNARLTILPDAEKVIRLSLVR